MRVKMLCRHTIGTGKKLESGLVYDLPSFVAQDLVSHGLAIVVVEAAPGFAPMHQKLLRSKTGRFLPRGGKK